MFISSFCKYFKISLCRSLPCCLYRVEGPRASQAVTYSLFSRPPPFVLNGNKRHYYYYVEEPEEELCISLRTSCTKATVQERCEDTLPAPHERMWPLNSRFSTLVLGDVWARKLSRGRHSQWACLAVSKHWYAAPLRSICELFLACYCCYLLLLMVSSFLAVAALCHG